MSGGRRSWLPAAACTHQRWLTPTARLTNQLLCPFIHAAGWSWIVVWTNIGAVTLAGLSLFWARAAGAKLGALALLTLSCSFLMPLCNSWLTLHYNVGDIADSSRTARAINCVIAGALGAGGPVRRLPTKRGTPSAHVCTHHLTCPIPTPPGTIISTIANLLVCFMLGWRHDGAWRQPGMPAAACLPRPPSTLLPSQSRPAPTSIPFPSTHPADKAVTTTCCQKTQKPTTAEPAPTVAVTADAAFTTKQAQAAALASQV